MNVSVVNAFTVGFFAGILVTAFMIYIVLPIIKEKIKKIVSKWC